MKIWDLIIKCSSSESSGACEGTITWNVALSFRTCLMPLMPVHVTVTTQHFHAQPHFTNETQLLPNSAL